VEFLTNSLQEHLETIHKLIDVSLSQIQQSGQMICDALTHDRKILICGNGGSAADAQHIAAEFVGRFLPDRMAMPALSLSTRSEEHTSELQSHA